MHQLNHDQAYLNKSGNIVLEILGRHSDDTYPYIEVRCWERTRDAIIKKGSLVKLSQETPSGNAFMCNMKKNGQKYSKRKKSKE